MPYTLLYSRSIASDSVVRILDVPITDKSVMIEVLSLISPFRRLFGYAYALRSDGITDYERSGGFILPFGKNRVNFASATVPYFLELFPRRGISSGIISVYTGEPGPPPPPHEWTTVLSSPYQMRLNTSPPGASYRSNPGENILDSAINGAVEAVLFYDFVFWLIADGSAFYKQVGPAGTSANATHLNDYQTKKSDPASVLL